MKNNKLVIFFGPPGSGKGTQASLLADKKKLFHLEASKALERRFSKSKSGEEVEIGGENYNLNEQKKRWKEGLLCEDGFVAFVIKEKIKSIQKTEEDVLLDGYPRTVKQLDPIMDFIFSIYNVDDILVIALKVEEEESIKRNQKRRVCSLMRHPIINVPETENLTICPIDGSLLQKRELDQEEVIRVRLQEFKIRTLPVLDYLSDKGVSISYVDGKGTVADVFSRVLKNAEDFGL